MNKNSLLTVGAALTIAGAAVVGGYYVDRMPTQTVKLETASISVPQKVAVAPHATKKSTTVAAVTTTTPTSKPARVILLRDAVADNSLVALTGTVTDKKGNVLMLSEASGPVRVVVREGNPQPWDAKRTVYAMDKIDVGQKVTIYGKVRTNEAMPKVYAEAVYTPSTKTLYQVNGDRPADELDGKAIMARYTPVDSVRATKVVTQR